MNIYNKQGNPTQYGFSLGYIQSKWNRKTHKTKELMKEHTTYHVKVYENNKRFIWESFETLTEARKFYQQIKLK